VILIADDQYINIEALKINLKEIGVQKKCEFFING